MKEYKTTEELIDYLLSKGLIINNRDNAVKILKKYSYYSIVNTYKTVFKDSNGNYKNNVTLEELYFLYDFDKNLRAIFLKYILEIEIIIKSLIAELISFKYGIKDYFVLSNFDQTIAKDVINDSLKQINDEIIKQNNKHEAVTHYLSFYGFLPPFVLTKILTFGELSRLYSILKQTDRQSISKEFKLSDKVLKQVLKNINMVRNICAHNDRLFSFHSKFLISFKYIDNKYHKKIKSTNLYMIMKSMKHLLDEYKAEEFENCILNEINKLSNNIKSIDMSIILYLMGFPNE